MTNQTLDPGVFEEMRELMDDALGEFIETYLDNSPKLISQIEQGLSNGDTDQIYQSAHQLKGGSGSIGAMKLAELATHIEKIAKAGSSDGIESLFSELKDEFVLLEQALRAAL